MSFIKNNKERLMSLVFLLFLLWKAINEFYAVANGTGLWFDGFSQKWFVAFISFIFFCLLLLALDLLVLWHPDWFREKLAFLLRGRERFKLVRWLGGLAVMAIPVLFLRLSLWSVVFGGIFIRLLFLVPFISALAFLLTFSSSKFIQWRGLLASALVFSFVLIIGAEFADVSMYPFSNGWSEGNRLWDYSILFGRDRYIYQPGPYFEPYLDFGRQLTGGLDFLYPDLSIGGARFWVDFINIFPYLILGFVIFFHENLHGNKRNVTDHKLLNLMMVFWTCIFLTRGPIHPPLVLSAILVALAWKQKYWISVPLLIVASGFAAISRFTWSFAVPIWIVMLEFASTEKVNKQTWVRSIVGVIAGLLGGVVLPIFVGFLQGTSLGIFNSNLGEATSQPLLWYRLLPNATYPEGVLIGNLIVITPVILLLTYLIWSNYWKLEKIQKICLVLPLLVFFVVGLIISMKAGGGGDLHNMDMLLIGFLFTAGIAWSNGGWKWVENIEIQPLYLKILILFMLVYPMARSFLWFRPIYYHGDVSWLLTLTDTSNPRSLGFLPSAEVVDKGLEEIRLAVQNANGDVLFMDQRQLLTFHYINARLVPEYEKKLVIDKAMTGDQSYFRPFYKDLAAHRFALIISEPLRAPIKNSEDPFGEENNIWVDWVSRPILCYYQPIETIPDLRLQLLVPVDGKQDCSDSLPFQVSP